MSAPSIRALRPDDMPALTAVNDAAAPAVPVTPIAELSELAEMASLALVVEDDAGPAGFVLALDSGLAYSSENYSWFTERSDDFLYVDRVVLDPRLHGRGIGRRLYAEVFAAAARAGRAEVTCEVNIEPPNPVSMAFHEALGFVRVGSQPTEGGRKVVALLAARVSDA